MVDDCAHAEFDDACALIPPPSPRAGYLCYIHMNDVQRRGNETHLYREHPFVKGTAEVGAYLPLGQRRAHRESIAQGNVWDSASEKRLGAKSVYCEQRFLLEGRFKPKIWEA